MVQGLGLDPNDLWKYLFQNGQMPNQQGFPVGDSREIDISSLPKELRDIINKSPTEFDEGAEDKIDTESEYRKLLEQMLASGQQIPGVNGSDLQNLSQDELTQLLVEWLLSKQSEQNQPGRDLGRMSSPAQHYGHGSSGAGYNNSGAGSSSGAPASGPVTAPANPTTAKDLKGNDNAEKALNYFINKGLTPEQAAGIVANLQAESGVTPGRPQINGPALGIAQWEGGRRTNMENFVANAQRQAEAKGEPFDRLAAELDFLWQEMVGSGDLQNPNGPENAALRALVGARSASEAAAIFENKFERPRDNHNAERGRIAEQVLATFGRGGGSMA